MHSAPRFALVAILALALVAVLAFCPLAHADTVFDFSATFNGVPAQSGPYPSSSQVTGTLTIDTVLGVVTGADIQSVATTFIYVNYGIPNGDSFVIELVNQNPPFPIRPGGGTSELDIILPVSSLVGYTGGLGCSNTYQPDPGCATSTANFVAEIILGTEAAAIGETVSLTPAVAQTPEPDSFVLLGTGLLGLASTIRYRHRPLSRTASRRIKFRV